MKPNLLTLIVAALVSIPSPRLAGQEEVEDILKRVGPAVGDAAEIADRVVTEIRAQPYGGGGYGALGNELRTQTWHRGQTARPVIVRTSEPDPKEQGQLEEDLNVMSRLLEKAIEGKAGKGRGYSTALGIDIYFKPGGNPMRSLYLEDHGAVFFLTVPFPLLAPPKTDDAKPKTPSNSEWEQARREVYGQPGNEPFETAHGDDYDQDRVDALKEALLDALKNGGNIRGLKPEETITISVTGGRGRGLVNWSKSVKPAPPGKVVQVFAGSSGPGGASSMLTLRARKSDIDAFARNKISIEEFRKKVRSVTYAAASGNASEGVAGAWGFAPPVEDIDVEIK